MSKNLILNINNFNEVFNMTPNMQRDLAISEFSEKINAALIANRMGSVRLIDYDKYSKSQLDGIDFITPEGTMDDKYIAGQLPTFSFEIGCFRYSDKYKGWFDPTKENLKTKFINLSYYTVSKEAGGTGSYKEDKELLVPFKIENGKRVYDLNDVSHIDNLEVITLDKKKLMQAVKDYFKENGLEFEKQIQNIKDEYKDNTNWMITMDITGKTRYDKALKEEPMRVVISNNIAERPINLVIRKEFMEKSGAIVYRNTYTRDDIKACLDMTKNFNKDSDIITRDTVLDEEQSGFCTLKLSECMQKQCTEVDKFEKEYFKRHNLHKQDLIDWYDKQEITEFDGLNNLDEYVEFYKYTVADMENECIPYCDYFEKLDSAADHYVKDYNSYEEMIEDNPKFGEAIKLSMQDYLENLSDLSDEIKEKYNLSNIEGLELN